MNNPLRIAIASKDGISVNLHFGHTDTFWIYHLTAQSIEFIEQRDVDKYCQGHTGNPTAMAKILETIKDCHAVFTAKIGEGPAEKLQNLGVTAVSDFAYEAIDESLKSYAMKIK